MLDIVHVGVNITHMFLPHGAHSLVEMTGRDQMTHKYMCNVTKVRHKQNRMSGERVSGTVILVGCAAGDECGWDKDFPTICQNLDDSEGILGWGAGSQDPLHHFSLGTWGTEGSKTPLMFGHHHPVR